MTGLADPKGHQAVAADPIGYAADLIASVDHQFPRDEPGVQVPAAGALLFGITTVAHAIGHLSVEADAMARMADAAALRLEHHREGLDEGADQ